MITHLSVTSTLATLGAKICPIAPPGAQQYADQLMGYVLWGIGLLFILGVVVGIGATVAGRAFAMPHASSRGAIGVAVAVIMAILFVTITAVITGVIGSGC